MIDQELIFEYFLKVVNVFAAHVLWGIAISLVLRYFNTLYKRNYLKWWSLSWLAFSFHILFAFGAFYFTKTGEPTFPHLLFTFLYCAAAFLQVIWLLNGITNLINKKSLNTKWEFLKYGLVIVLAIIVTLVHLFYDQYEPAYALIIPIIMKSLILGLAFILSGVILMRVGRRQQAMGKTLLWISFLLYGFQNLGYFKEISEMLIDKTYVYEVNYLLSTLDFLLLALMGVGMIIWILEDERTKLEKTNRELDSFLYSTSHDLRAPVASLLGLINIARHDIKEEEGKKYINMMEERVLKLDHIFGDILSYSRNIKTDIKLDTFRLGEIVDDVINDVKFNEGADSIRLIFNEEIHQMLRTDYYQLKMILSNLIANAVKYHDSTKSDQWIAIQFDRLDNDVQITIEDNGKGIHPESQHKVFDMFYRATSEAEGSGLGLFIVKQALEKINGQIRLKSELGKGSKFKIIINDAAIKPIVLKNA